ncbi:hypothetical protein OG589_07710 [Sphaerisporangium sp. NBC_01403]|uniref:hypothetical protein n=1 Tax=Sphaerisporangium sp. NBC_01403 TaxID=2903599 RepID=UPI00324C94A5
MPDNKLKLSQVAALLVLMAEAKEVSNTELGEAHGGYTLTGEDRRKLNQLKLVESWKQGRTYVHVLTEDGWTRVIEELGRGIERPKSLPGAALHAALSAMLGGVQRYMDRTGNKLGEIFTAPGYSTQAESLAPAGPKPSSQTSERPGASPALPAVDPDLEKRIRAIYAELAGEPGKYVGLAELRALLPDVSRRAVDNALRSMNRLPDVNIVPESNQKKLSMEDREAAVTLGDQEKHLLWIGA